MKKIQVLLIAPYESMLRIAQQEARNFPDIQMTGALGDLQKGADIAKQYSNQDFDVVISRGGTAELIRTQTGFPVIDVEPSVSDILRTIRLASAGTQRYAIVGFPAVTKNASVLCDILRYTIEIHTIHDAGEARKVLSKLVEDACPMVLCDVVTSSIAQEFGIPSLLVTSGSECFRMAFERVRQLVRYYAPLRRENRMLRNVVEAQKQGTYLFSGDGEVLFSAQSDEIPSVMLERLKEKQVYADREERRLTLNADGRQFIARVQPIGDARTLVIVQGHTARPASEKFGITYQNRDEALDSYFHSFYGVTQPSYLKLYEQHTRRNVPLMILGEIGTGKEQMARLLYCRGPFANAPMCTIDCSLLRNRGWEYLMTSPASPLNDQGTCVHFKRMNSLEESQFSELTSLMETLSFHKNNQVIFSMSTTVGEDGKRREKYLLSLFSCSMVALPALREHKKDIPQLASLYIGQLNLREGKESVGFEPEALQILMDYDWPGNYDQFKRILKDLISGAEGHYIQKREVEDVLKKEKVVFDTESPVQTSNLSGKTMEEIQMLAVAQALADHQNNQTEAARQLGIARTSLWRMMKKG